MWTWTMSVFFFHYQPFLLARWVCVSFFSIYKYNVIFYSLILLLFNFFCHRFWTFSRRCNGSQWFLRPDSNGNIILLCQIDSRKREPIAQKLCDNKYKNCITLFQHKWCACAWVQFENRRFLHNKMLKERKKEEERKREWETTSRRRKDAKKCASNSYEKPQAINLNQSPKKEKLNVDCCFIARTAIFTRSKMLRGIRTHTVAGRSGRSTSIAKRNRIKYFQQICSSYRKDVYCIIASAASNCYWWICPNAFYHVATRVRKTFTYITSQIYFTENVDRSNATTHTRVFFRKWFCNTLESLDLSIKNKRSAQNSRTSHANEMKWTASPEIAAKCICWTDNMPSPNASIAIMAQAQFRKSHKMVIINYGHIRFGCSAIHRAHTSWFRLEIHEMIDSIYRLDCPMNCKNFPFDCFWFVCARAFFPFRCLEHSVLVGKPKPETAKTVRLIKQPSNKSHILDNLVFFSSGTVAHCVSKCMDCSMHEYTRLCTKWKTNVKIGILTIRNFSAFTNTYIKWMPFTSFLRYRNELKSIWQRGEGG